MGLILSSFLLAFALGQLVVGPLSDRIGRTRPILWGLALFAAGSVVVAAAPGLPLMLAGRVLQALGVCSAAVLSRAIARDLFDGPDLARVLSLTMVAMAAAPGFSPLIGGLLMEKVGLARHGAAGRGGRPPPRAGLPPPARRDPAAGATAHRGARRDRRLLPHAGARSRLHPSSQRRGPDHRRLYAVFGATPRS